MSDDLASAKIRMLKNSLTCFVCGLLGLLPLIGLPFALVALWISGRIRLQEKQLWNAAEPYRIWGVVCAAVGTVFGRPCWPSSFTRRPATAAQEVPMVRAVAINFQAFGNFSSAISQSTCMRSFCPS